MVTQIEIAEVVGLDVSSVNKILGRDPRPKFRKDTVARVFKVARQMGYDFSRETKHSLRAENKSLKNALLDLWGCRLADGVGTNLSPKPETIAAVDRLIEEGTKKKRKTG